MERKTMTGAFARRLLAEWRRLSLPETDEARVVVAVSGGADSTALLLACEELTRARRLKARVTVAHLEHGLRGETGERDARGVEELAARFGFACVTGRADVRGRAEDLKDNLEQAARRARYEFLGETARAVGASAVLTAHTLDDQAETVLLRLLRGSGAQGLGGIRPVRRLATEGATLLVRPLVRWARRAETEAYCRARGVEALVDEMNADERFARVRVRRRLVPLLESFNPRAVEALARTAELLREDAFALEAAARVLLAEAAETEDVECATEEVESTTEDVKGATEEVESMTGDVGGATDDVESATVDVGGATGAVEGATGEDAMMLLLSSFALSSLSSVPVETDGAAPLRVDVLARAAVAVRRRALRQWIARGRGDLRRVEAAHVLAVERLLAGERGGRVAELPGGARVERRRGRLRFYAPSTERQGKRVEKGQTGN